MLLDRVNRLMKAWSGRALNCLADLYSEVDETLLMTLPELDQYPRPGYARYSGPIIPSRASPPRWPNGTGRRLFAYLKPTQELPDLLRIISETKCPAIVFIDGSGSEPTDQELGSMVHVQRHPVDLARVGAECSAAILHAGQGTTAALLLAGKPLLQIPLVFEQQLTANATLRLGAGEVVLDRGRDTPRTAAKLAAVLSDARYSDAAARFAHKYAAWNPSRQVEQMVDRLDCILS
jgi:UDP:flavonoid glycosyltransferase YjiC (YdhE family)